MNCQEYQKLIAELADLSLINENSELSEHICGCKACQSFLSYERKLREGFAVLGNEPMPAEIARKILSIPVAHASEVSSAAPDWLEKIHALINSLPFKVAFASGISGFLLALALFYSPAPEQSSEKLKSIAHSEEKKLQGVNMASLPQPPVKMRETGDKRRENDVIPPKITADEIPGAVSFALEKQQIPAESDFADSEIVRFSQSEVDASSQAPIFLAKSEAEGRPVSARSRSYLRHEGFAAAPILLEENREAEVAEDVDEAIEDPRAAEIFELLRANNLVAEGFVDLEKLLVRGYISGRQLREWRPPSGNGWYITSKEAGSRLVLRKKP